MFRWSDWFSITPYSFIDLAVLAICFSLAAAFYLIYYHLGRRLVDLIFANCLACITVMAFGFFTEDNTESPLVALRWARINFSMAALFSAFLLHLVFLFLKDHSRRAAKIIPCSYGISLIAAVSSYSPEFYHLRTGPLEPRSWTNVSPAFPEVSMAQNVFTIFFLILTGFTLFKLYTALSRKLVEPRAFQRTKLLFYGVSTLTILFAFDYALYAFASVCTIAFALFGFIAVCLPAAIALGEEVIDNRRLKEALSKYVSPQVTDEILSRGLLLEDRDCEVTVLFADIRDFTHITRELGPKGITRFLSHYLSTMTEVIFRHEGMLIQTVGDGLLAVFGTGKIQINHELAAVKAALDMRAALAELSLDSLHDKPIGPVRIGIGLHSGKAIIGNVGGPKHVDYRVTGEIVNIASRVERHTKVAGHPLLITTTTYAAVAQCVSAQPAGEAIIKEGESSIPVMAVHSLQVPENITSAFDDSVSPLPEIVPVGGRAAQRAPGNERSIRGRP